MEYSKHSTILAVVEGLLRRGSWTGKTHVQKALSLLSDARLIPPQFDFVLYKHGPYSFDVENEIEQMRSYEAVNIYANPNGYGVTIRPGTNAFFVKRQAPLSAGHQAAIEKVCEFVDARSVTVLERLATAAWIRTNQAITETAEVARRLNALKPHVSIADAVAADQELAHFLACC